MQLLVSVRSGVEARTAAAAGADVVDAKDPSQGALGAVPAAVLLQVCAEVPAPIGLSAAAGDGTPGDLLAALHSVPILPRPHVWLKFAVRGAFTPAVPAGLAAAAGYLEGRPDRPRLVLARYADESLVDIGAWIEAAARVGVDGILLDTRRKDGGSLLEHAPLEVLHRIRRAASAEGLWLGLAGRLSLKDVGTVSGVGPDVIGVRGAACTGGRDGAVSEERVQVLVREVRRSGAQSPARSASLSAVVTET